MCVSYLLCLNILINDFNISIAIGPSMFVPKSDHVTKFVNYNPEFVTIFANWNRLRPISTTADKWTTSARSLSWRIFRLIFKLYEKDEISGPISGCKIINLSKFGLKFHRSINLSERSKNRKNTYVKQGFHLLLRKFCFRYGIRDFQVFDFDQNVLGKKYFFSRPPDLRHSKKIIEHFSK